MTKREIEEIFSYIRHTESNPQDYTVVYRDFDDLKEVLFLDFEQLSKDFIPEHRIMKIIKKGEIIFQRKFPKPPSD